MGTCSGPGVPAAAGLPSLRLVDHAQALLDDDLRRVGRGDRDHHLGWPLPAPPGEARRVCFMRHSGLAFDERDRQLAALLRPHLQEIWLDAERRRAGIPPLTAREWEVLALAAAGMPYAAIAEQLFISTGTVRKHMEHVR